MKGKTLHIFVRFGGLDLKNQKGYSNDPGTFHSPPAPRGFYAMPKVAQEFFLISSMDKFQPSTVPKNKPAPEGLSYDEEIEYWNDYHKRHSDAISSMRKEFTKKDGNIWHHLGNRVPNNEIIDRHGQWVKTSISAWAKAFRKESLACRYGDSSWFHVTSINEPGTSKPFGVFSKDHLEVFFDEKV
jgi:hypothetical protein